MLTVCYGIPASGGYHDVATSLILVKLDAEDNVSSVCGLFGRPAVSKRFGWCLSAVSPPESHGVEAAETVGPDATSRVNDVGGGWVLTVAVAKGKSAVMNNVCKSEEGMEGGEGVKDWLCGGHRSEPPSNRFTKSKHLLRGRSALNHSTTEGNRYCSDCCCGETVVPPQTRRFSGAHLVSNL
ncbi:hypothetical protein FQA47_002282 [Oryzias melastigma]|uniref:Uncharacterized protein n=1 Tax=Oryzias melastigma TaxID=30732 RepID=A0A834BVC7_ORYME|nr:hypothetical protein FQA47_002282 [Oryzias melastigma]